ncbi:MAG: 4Fe-4S binding protein, partial [Oscillospiraceae bacterium]
PYNIDIALCKIADINISDASTVYNAIKRGLSVSDFSELNMIGDTLTCYHDYKMPQAKDLAFYDAMPKFLVKPMKPIIDRFLTSKPVIQKKKCIGCGKCSESCPADTISIADKKAIIDYSNCIKCFCCHEMCPVKAIEIKRLKMFDF